MKQVAASVAIGLWVGAFFTMLLIIGNDIPALAVVSLVFIPVIAFVSALGVEAWKD